LAKQIHRASMRAFATTAHEAWRIQKPLDIAKRKLSGGDAWWIATKGRHMDELISKALRSP
jgi:hypothetical protein